MNPSRMPPASGDRTITHAAGGNESGTPEELELTVIRRPGRLPTIEIHVLLRKRLRFLALVIVAFYGLLLQKTLQDSWAAGVTWTDLGLYEAFECTVLITATGLAWLLGRKRQFSLRRLRTIELVLFGMVMAQFVWVDYRTLVVYKLPARLAMQIEDRFALLVVGAQLLTWFVLVVSYGTLIPNTWRRCAAVVCVMAVTPVVTSTTASLVTGGIPRQLLGRYLAAVATWMGVIAVIAVYGSHRIEALRQHASSVRRLGQYRLKRRLGTGGMGEVYLAEHAFLRRPCALKLLRPERARLQDLLRFEREVQTTATLTHPNTVQIFDYGHAQDGTFYYVMEFLPGLTLEQLVEQQGALRPERAVHLLRQICGALAEAHDVGLIHRDVKPSNIIACNRGGHTDVVKLVDFGLVQTRDITDHGERLTQEGAIAGTPAFMSPEQAAGRALDARSDIYSLGAVAFFLLTGHPPFERDTIVEVLAAHLMDPVIFPNSLEPSVPRDVQAVVARCLEKDPARRFQDAVSLDKALAQCSVSSGVTGSICP